MEPQGMETVFMNRVKRIYHVQPNELLRDRKNVVTPVSQKALSDAEPLYILYYPKMFISPHYQSCRPIKPKESGPTLNQSNYDIKQNTLPSIDLSKISNPEFESRET